MVAAQVRNDWGRVFLFTIALAMLFDLRLRLPTGMVQRAVVSCADVDQAVAIAFAAHPGAQLLEASVLPSGHEAIAQPAPAANVAPIAA